MWHKPTGVKMLIAPLLLQGDPSQEQEGGPPGLWHAASPWHRSGKQEISQSGMAAKSIQRSPVAGGGSRGRLPCFQHPCRRGQTVSDSPRQGEAVARGKI